MVLGSPYASASTQTALDFAQQTINSGRLIERLFFYHEAAYIANLLGTAAQDELDIPQAWSDFIQQNNIAATCCIASAIKRGVIDEAEAKRYSKNTNNLHPAIELGGLGEWVEATLKADKTIVFGK